MERQFPNMKILSESGTSPTHENAEFLAERAQVGKENNIINLDILTKVGNEWFASGLTLDEYNKIHDRHDLPSHHL